MFLICYCMKSVKMIIDYSIYKRYNIDYAVYIVKKDDIMKKAIKTELTREKILSAALKEFGTNGYAGSSLNNICNTGIAKGLLYHNYASKDALYLACVKHCFQSLTEYLQAADIGTDPHHYARVRLCLSLIHI